MTSVLLTAPIPVDVHVSVDRHRTSGTQRHVALPLDFGLSAPSSVAVPAHPFITDAGTTTHNTNTNDDDDGSAALSSDADTHTHPLVQRQWTGAPIRAIVPLPRRASASPHGVTLSNAPVNTGHTTVGTPTRFVKDNVEAAIDADADSDSDSEITIEIVPPQEDDGDEDEDDAGQGTRSRYCSYESITAAQGLSAWSFEELRAECYAQSLVARGARPAPVVQPSLAIPPAFTPRIVSRR